MLLTTHPLICSYTHNGDEKLQTSEGGDSLLYSSRVYGDNLGVYIVKALLLKLVASKTAMFDISVSVF